MRNGIDKATRREMVEKLLSMEQTVNAPTASAKVVDGYYSPCCGGCANDGCCSSTCAWTWTPIKG